MIYALPILVRLALVVAVLMAIAFIAIPIYLYLFGDPNLVHTATSGGH